MAIDYGTERIFRDVKICEACGSNHTELEFKRMVLPREEKNGYTHKGRCPKARQWIYIRLDS